MNNQPNTLVTTEWLYPFLKEELTSLHGKMRYASETDELLLIAESYHNLFGVLKVANLPYFAQLAHSIELTVSAVVNGFLSDTYVHKSLYASELLLHELTNYVQTGNYHQQLISNRQDYLHQILLSHNALDQLKIAQLEESKAQENIRALSATEVSKGADKDNGFTLDFSSSEEASFIKSDTETYQKSDDENYDNNHGTGISLSCLTDYIKRPDGYDGYALSDNQRRMLIKVWRMNTHTLLSANKNDEDALNHLRKVADYMQDDAIANLAITSANLWYLTMAWLESLTLNEKPTPTVYAHLLSKLDAVIGEKIHYDNSSPPVTDSTSLISSKVNDSLVDVYIQLRSLEVTTESASDLLTKVTARVDEDNEFFPRLLSQLEHIIFKINSPKDIIAPLKSLKAQLHNRGWLGFQEQINQILNDLETSIDSKDVFSQMRWAIERQLQDLYASILSAYETIDSQIGEQQPTYYISTQDGVTSSQDNTTQDNTAIKNSSTDDGDSQYNIDQLSPQTIRRVRIAIEDIKHGFNKFLQEHDTKSLDKPDEFSTLQSAFEEMGLAEAIAITERSAQVFQSIIGESLQHITWELTDAIAEALASLELFMDYLAQQTLDSALLEQVDSRLIQAEQHLEHLIDDPDILNQSSAKLRQGLVNPVENVTRYDDSGELAAVEPLDSSSDTSIITEHDEHDSSDSQKSNSQETDSQETDSQEPVRPTTEEPLAQKTTEQTTSNDSEELLAARAELKDDDFDMDEEIREIFIEEAEEVLETLDIYLPKWEADPQNLEPLSEIRRSFHTLKGSGRMVGAHNAGEMAWAVENLLNRVLDGTLSVDGQLIGFIKDTKELIPTLVDDFSKEQSPSIDPAVTVLKARNLQMGRSIDYGLNSDNLNSGDLDGNANDSLVNDSLADGSLDNSNLDNLGNLDNNNGLNSNALNSNVESPVEENISEHTYEVLGVSTPVEPVITEADLSADISVSEDTLNQGQPQAQHSDVFETPDVLKPLIADVPEDANDADPDIKEIFIEEAQEVLEEITPKYKKWQDNLEDFELLTDVRRGFHTLKGSGRMVGANSTAELAWSVENMLNRVLDDTIKPNEGIQALVGDVLEAYPDMVSTYEQGDDNYPEILPLWIACANGYAKKLGGDFNYKSIAINRQNSIRAKQTKNADSEEILESERHGSTSEILSDSDGAVLESMTTANLKLQKATDTVNQLPKEQGNNDFEQVFLDEAAELISKIEQFVEQNEGVRSVDIDDEMVRAFHTLRGAAGSQALQAISDVSSTVESSLEHLQQNDEPMTAEHLQAISESVCLIKKYVEDFKATAESNINLQDVDNIQEMFASTHSTETSLPFNVSDIISDDIDDVLDAEWELEQQLSQSDEEQIKLYVEVLAAQCDKLLSRVGESKKFFTLIQSLKAVYTQIFDTPDITKDQAVIGSLLAGHQQLTGLLDSLAASMTLKLDPQVIANLNAIAMPSLNLSYESMAEEAVDFEEIATDEELLEIFLEEAQEIDADITNSFSSWKENPHDLNALKVLQRHLHTIKGGARMAGIASIGDLTHEAETIYEYFVEDKIEPTAQWVSLMQSVQDILSQQIDYVVNHGKSFHATHLIEQLHNLEVQREIPDDFRLELPKVPTAKTDDIQYDQPAVDDTITKTNVTEQEFEAFKQKTWNGIEPDADILEVFLEEAEELVDSSAMNMQAFRTNTSNIAALQELQRELHTLKGGARMVGANGIADLAHEMETVYEDLASRRRPATKMISQLLATCHDWIAEAVYLLTNGINPPIPNPLIKELQNFTVSPDDLQTIPQVSLQEYLEVIAKYEEWRDTRLGNYDISEMPTSTFSNTESEEGSSLSNEMIRVSSGLMEQMINLSGESAINRARIDMSVTSLNSTIDEMGMTVQRLADQLRRMDIELEAQILSQIEEDQKLDESFDPLEMDQYSSLNQLSKSLSESASDLLDIKTTMLDKTRDAEDLLLQLSRTQAELQDGLMNSRMVPFSRLTPRLQRIARQTANELKKSVELTVINADDEIDRTILERITSPLEHMLRNAVDHGIESTEERQAKGKDSTGHVVLEVMREGSEIVIKLTDDGRGIDVEAVRKKAVSQGLIEDNDTSLTDLDIMQYIFNAGLTTTSQVTQISGRGVGMDVVLSEIRQLGGTVSVDSKPNEGSTFAMRVPLTVAISDALVVRVADRYYAIPLIQIERVERVNPEALFEFYQSDKNTFEIGETEYRLRYLNEILAGVTLNELAVNMNVSLPVIIVKNQTGQNLALQVDEVAGSRIEVVVKPLGRQLSQIPGLSAATIMGDGSVMLILDILALMRNAPVRSIQKKQRQKRKEVSQSRPKILVVDDSVTVRKVTTRLLERQGYDAYVARDGVDALEILQELKPDLMLLDIEMPRMDGFDVAQNVRHDKRLQDLPIVMITSRTGDKHRERAIEIGVNDYMGKPFQEAQLISTIQNIIGTTMGDNYD